MEVGLQGGEVITGGLEPGNGGKSDSEKIDGTPEPGGGVGRESLKGDLKTLKEPKEAVGESSTSEEVSMGVETIA